MKHKFKRFLSVVSAVIVTSSALPMTELTLFAEDDIQEEIINEIYETPTYLTISDVPLVMASEANNLAYTNAENFAADCILQGLTDINTGESLSDFVLYSQVLRACSVSFQKDKKVV